MINRNTILIISALVASFVSCSKHNETEIEKGNVSSFDLALRYADLEAETDTKQYVSGIKYETYWDASDEVAVYNATKGELNRYVVKSGENTKIAVFTPYVGTAPSYDASDDLYIIYPYEAASLDGGTLYLSIYRDAEEDSYSKSDNKVFSRNDLMMSGKFTPESISQGDIDTGAIPLNHLVAFVNLTSAVSHDVLSGETIKRVRFKCKGVAGRAAVTFTNGNPSLAYNGGSEDECVFQIEDAPKMAHKEYLARFIPIFPVNMQQDPNNGFSFILENEIYGVGFHRALDHNMRSNGNFSYILSNGLFGLDSVAESEATTDFSWWWSPLRTLSHDNEYFTNGTYYYGEANCLVIPKGTQSASLDVSLYKVDGDRAYHARGSMVTEYRSAATRATVIWTEGMELTPSLSWIDNQCTMTVTKADANNTGNALVGLYDSGDHLLWSFHVWAPVDGGTPAPNVDDIPDGYEIYSKAYNLALGQIDNAYDSYMYYQWGRKDPLGRSASIPDANNTLKTLSDNFTLGIVAANQTGESGNNLDYARKNPTVFITKADDSSNTIDWYPVEDVNDASHRDNYLWNVVDGKGSIYDPCPKDYHVPADNSLWYNDVSFTPSISNYAFERRGIYYVLGGSRYYGDGSVSIVGSNGYYWSSTPKADGRGAYNMGFNASSASPSRNSNRAGGFAVRCVQN